MKVLVKISHSGPYTNRAPGKVYDVPDEEGKRMIAAGMAVPCPKELEGQSLGSGENASIKAQMETAALGAAEKAVKAKPRKKKRRRK